MDEESGLHDQFAWGIRKILKDAAEWPEAREAERHGAMSAALSLYMWLDETKLSAKGREYLAEIEPITDAWAEANSPYR